MNYHSINRKEENKDRIKSGIITAFIWSVILVFLFLYKVTEKIPKKKEVITQILINFGDNRNGDGLEEPANQEGSLVSENNSNIVTETSATKSTVAKEKSIASKAFESKKEVKSDKLISGNNSNHLIKKTESKEIKTAAKTNSTAKSNNKGTSSSIASTANSNTGDGKGTAAIGNLIRGRGTKTGSQGTGNGTGNIGDPLGGDGNGDSKIGIDRKLIGYIPGTMGRNGTQPSHNCTAYGTITISYIVDKAGNVVSARKSGGISDACIVSTSISWVKKYVKAEKATSFSTGTYHITF